MRDISLFQGTEIGAPGKWHQEDELRVTGSLEQRKRRSEDRHLTGEMLSLVNG
jgi:hypothetical protein